MRSIVPARIVGHRALIGLAVVALALAACNAASAPAANGTPGPPTGSGAGNAVTIAGFKFNPATIDVPVGTTVTWTNNDSTAHTVTADGGSFDSKPINPGGMFSQVFTTAGTFTYHCSIHPTMKATVTVH